MDVHLILVIVIAAALAFDFTNGFHDTANVVATSISTGAASPKAAVTFAAILNFVGAFISIEVASTIAKDVVDPNVISLNVVYAGLMGAIAWNLITWYFGLPSSSSHALIGGLVGAAVAAVGTGAVETAGLIGKVLVPALVAPILAFLVAAAAIAICYRIVGHLRPGPVTRGYRYGQIVSGGLLALAHGTNDAQKTMGIITLALISDGVLGEGSNPPTWVIVSAASAIALGTYSGGWRIIKTTGTKIIKMDSAQGFSAQGAGAAVIMASSHFGFPLSTTHVINGGVMGAGVAKRLSAVRWGVAGNIVGAWVLTLPAAAAIGALAYGITVLAGGGAVGPVVISALSLVAIAAAFIRRARTGAPSADGTGAPVTEDATGLIVEGGEVMTVDGKPVSESGALLGADDEREGQVR
ncbi:MAG: inorganic phosphate transporter [Solirubrobacterales bacterium]|nr:inorganic phosphate transporter [Solirubrobacterales bacterium]